jgi:transmembrane E3 ubiquitin-protein ligase
MVPEVLMRELEEEVQKPTGSWTVKPPELSVRGVLISKECGILYEMQNTQGLR